MREKIAVIGAGSWGTAITIPLSNNNYSVSLWARDVSLARSIQETRVNSRYLSQAILPNLVSVTGDIEEAVSSARVVVLAVPSHGMRTIVRHLKNYLKDDAILVSLAKGIEMNTMMRMSEVIAEEVPSILRENIAVLSGPNHAEEVSRKIPSATVVSAFKREIALKLQPIFMTSYFRVYTNSDMVGVELGGATKNVIAIAAGISDGLGFGDNTKASLMTRGLAEMTRLGKALGANPLTFSGLSGVGDLIVTCTSRYSRNRAVGEKIGQGMSLQDITREMNMVAEGIRTSKAIKELAEKHEIEVPITKNVTEVLYEGKNPRDCVVDLMMRGAKDEIELF